MVGRNCSHAMTNILRAFPARGTSAFTNCALGTMLNICVHVRAHFTIQITALSTYNDCMSACMYVRKRYWSYDIIKIIRLIILEIHLLYEERPGTINLNFEKKKNFFE